jgi:poly(beta-D-mannuronate) lyase
MHDHPKLHRPLHFWRVVSAIISVWFAVSASAATYTVNSLSALQAQINTALADDTIIVQNGVYTSSSTISISRVGTATKPILIAAETVGGVEIRGSSGFSFSSPAAYVTVQGFKLTHANSISIPSGTSHCRLSRNIIELTIPKGSDVSYINISGDDVEIDRNELRNKSTLGEMLDIAGSGSQVARRLWVHHNYFHDFSSPGGNGAETIRWGLSGLSLSTGAGICEYNLFVRCEGENEMISNKSSGNIYRYNSVIDCVGGEISQRHGNDCLYYGNYMRNTQGIRIYGDRHLIFSNYLEGNSSAINMGNGDGDVYNGAALTAHDRPDNCVVVFNTLINNSTQYEMGGRTGGLGATNVTFANNIIQGGGTAVSISTSAPYTGTWSGNILWQTGGIGDIPSSGYTIVNPLLRIDGTGAYHLQAGSPAIGAAVGSFPTVTVDMDGQPRDATVKAVGADEFSSAPVIARILTTADVGPASSGDIGPAPVVNPPTISTSPASQTVIAGATVTFSVQAIGSGLSYQWSFNGTALATGTNATLTLTNVFTTQAGTYTAVVSNSGGSVTSNPATLTVNIAPPRITQQPNSLTIANGGSVNFSVGASGTGLSYQWSFNGAPIAGATNAILTVANVSDANAGSYLVTVSNSGGSVTSATVTLTVTLAAPGISQPPSAYSLTSGDPVVLTVGATGGGLHYQWQRNGIAIAGATDATYLATNVSADAAYTVVVSNAVGSATSAPAALTVSNPVAADRGRIINLAIRSAAGAGGQTLIVGSVVGGTGTSGGKSLLIRAAGPSLAGFGVTDALADPALTVFSSANQIVAQNDNWSGDADVVARSAQVGAFPFSSSTSADAAVFAPALTVGGYTVQVGGKDTATGVALAEVYDATATTAVTDTTPRLINVSARTQVGTDTSILICGFVLGGTTSKTVLIRAVGPTLARYGVTGLLADPRLELFRGSTSLAVNDNWGGGATLASAFTSVGAFDLDAVSKDAALLVTLPPGAYTAQVSGVGNTTGVALVEVYALNP